jgi:hypothetical protein
MHQILIRQHLQPGDDVVLTGAVHNLRAAGYQVSVETPWFQAWFGNKDVANEKAGTVIDLTSVVWDTKTINYVEFRTKQIGSKLGVVVPVVCRTPQLYLSAEERAWTPPWPRYAVVNFGCKDDYTVKQIPLDCARDIARYLRSAGVVPVQVGREDHRHQAVDGCVDWIGRTSLRGLFTLTAKATVVVCGVTLTHHVAAAFGVPSVVIGGGREDAAFHDYPTTTYLSTVGELDCCRAGGCWLARTRPENDGSLLDRRLCLSVVGDSPECQRISGRRAVEALASLLGSSGADGRGVPGCPHTP